MHAALAAVNGVNPIPGLDIGVDISLLMRMGVHVRDIYCLGEEQQHFITELLDKKNSKVLAAKAVQFGSKYLGKEAVILLLKRAGATVAAKSASKYFPFIGIAISSTVGFFLTSSIGKEMVTDAEAIANENYEALKALKIKSNQPASDQLVFDQVSKIKKSATLFCMADFIFYKRTISSKNTL